MRCWQCGVEPLDVHEIATLSDPQPTYIAGRWPDGDHQHAVAPPTPSELADQGDHAVARILAIGAE